MAVKSKTALGTDIDTKLASASNITATEHRSLEHDIVDSYEDFIGSYTTVQIAALSSMTLRQIVYDTTLNEYFFYNGSAWIQLSSMFKKGAGAQSLMDKRSSANTGAAGTTVGVTAQNTAENGMSIGTGSVNTGVRGSAIGASSQNTGDDGSAFGAFATNSAAGGQGIGDGSHNRIEDSTNISGAIVIRKSDTESDTTPYKYSSGSEIIILSPEVDLKVQEITTITVPSGVRVFVNEVGTIMTDADTVSGQPTVSFGITGNEDFLLAATATTGLTAVGKRDRQTSVLEAEGVTSLVAEVTVSATGTTAKGRFYFKGFIVENQ